MEYKQYKLVITYVYTKDKLVRESSLKYLPGYTDHEAFIILKFMYYLMNSKNYRDFINKFGEFLFQQKKLYKKNVYILFQKIDEFGELEEELFVDKFKWDRLKRRDQLMGGRGRC